jgi:hypothetical protein
MLEVEIEEEQATTMQWILWQAWMLKKNLERLVEGMLEEIDHLLLNRCTNLSP